MPSDPEHPQTPVPTVPPAGSWRRAGHRLARIAGYAIAGVIVAAALLVSLVRLLVPMVPDYHQEIEDWVGGVIDARVRVERVDAGWRGAGPSLVLQGVALIDPRSNLPLLRFTEVEVGVDLLSSLLTGTPQTGHLRLTGGSLDVLRSVDGRVLVRGMGGPAAAPATDSGQVLGWLLSQSSLGLLSTDIRFEDRAREQVRNYRFEDVNLLMKNSGSQHRIKARIELPEGLGESAELRMRFTGWAEQPEEWQGEVYLRVDDIRVAELGRLIDNPWVQIGTGRASVELWGSWRERMVEDLRLDFLADGLSLQRKSAGSGVPVAEIDRASGLLDIRGREKGGWRVELRRFETAWTGGTTAPVDGTFDIEYERQTGRLQLDGVIDTLRLQEWTPYVGLLALPEAETGEWLRRLAPEGELERLRLQYSGNVSGPGGVAVAAGFEGLSIEGGVQGIPSLNGLDGRFEMRGDEAVVELSTEDASVDFHGYFRRPILADALTGELRLRFRPGVISVASGDILIRNEDVDGRLRLAMDIEPGADTFLDLRAHVYRARGANTYRYLPVGSLDESIVAWLDRAITDGRGHDVDVLYYGRLGDFLDYDTRHNGRFEVRFKVDDATLDYFEGWPPITAEHARIAFINESMSARVVKGQTLGVPIGDGSVEIPDLGKAVVYVDAKAKGDVGPMLEFVRRSPLGPMFAAVVADTTGGGEGTLGVALVIPVSTRAEGELDVEVDLELADAWLRSPERNLDFTGITGRFLFSEEGVRAEAVQAKLHDEAVRIDIDRRDHEARRWTALRVRGDLALDRIAAPLGSTLVERIQGQAPWDVTIEMAHETPGKASHVTLRMESNLEGVDVALPAPLGKRSEVSRRFVLETGMLDGEPTPVRLTLGDGLRGVVELGRSRGTGWTVRRGAISLGGDAPTLPRDDVWDLRGSIDRLSLSEWGALLAELDDAGDARPLVDRLGALNVTIARLEALGYELGTAHVASEGPGARVRLRLSSPLAKGNVIIPSSAQPGAPITASLESLRLEPAQVERSGEFSDPREWPSIRANVARLQTQEYDVEDVRLEITPERNGLRVHLLSFEASGLAVRIEGDWVVSARGRQRSDFRIEANSEDIGTALDELGLSQAVVGGKSEATAKLRWPDAPFAFGWDDLRGEAQLKMEKGSLRDIDPKAGRLIGLFSVEALPRRLQLDFDDVAGEGFVFDSIEGSFSISGPQIYTKDLKIKGRSARFDLTGRAGVLARDYDQIVTVTPKLDATLPIAGAIAGGTGVGAVVLVLQQAFKRPIERSMQFKYTVTGSWDDPQIERIQAPESFEGEGSRGPLEYE